MTQPGQGSKSWQWVRRYLSLGFCLTVAQGRSEAELMAGFGVDESSVEVMTADEAAVEFEGAGPVVRIGRVGEWGFGWQAPGAEIGQADVVGALSRGGRALSVWRSGSGGGWFTLMVDGELELAFEPLFAERRRGAGAERYVPVMREVGLLVPDALDTPGADPSLAALALLTALSGVILDAGSIEGPLLTGEIGVFDDSWLDS